MALPLAIVYRYIGAALATAEIADLISTNFFDSPEFKKLNKVLGELSEIDSKISDGFAGRNVARGADIRKREVELKVIAEGIVSNENMKGPVVGYRGSHGLEMDQNTDNKNFRQNLLLMKKSKELDDLNALQGLHDRTPAARTDISAAMSATDPSNTSSSSSTYTGVLAPLEPLMQKIDDLFVAMDEATKSITEAFKKFDDALTKGGFPRSDGETGTDLVPGLQQASAAAVGVSNFTTTVVEEGEENDPTAHIKKGVNDLNAVFDDLGKQTEDIFLRMAQYGDISAQSIGDSFKRLALNTLFQKLIPSLFGVAGKATGGSINAGTPYIVGEKGPELIVPHSGGTVKPNLKGISGNNTQVTQNNHFTTDVKNSVRAEVLNAAPHIVNQAVSVISEQMRRGTRYI